MNTRFRCPNCHRNKKFVRYIDTKTGEQIAHNVGRCERIDSCGYHYTPKQYFQDNNVSYNTTQMKSATMKKTFKSRPKPVSYIPIDVFKESLKNYGENNFVKFLMDLFGVDVSTQLITQYFIASSDHWNGATTFWQIDINGNIRTGKIMLYNPSTGKRVKEPFNHITWVHTIIKQPDYELKQCFFGEHLLKSELLKQVAIVESEKTAIIASVYLPEFIWLAAGSKEGLTFEKCKILKGRTVCLFPDLNGFELWDTKKKEISAFARVTISDLLERKATKAERNQGLDLADYLIKLDYKTFRDAERNYEPESKRQEVILNKSPEIIPTLVMSKSTVKDEPVKEEGLDTILVPGLTTSEENLNVSKWQDKLTKPSTIPNNTQWDIYGLDDFFKSAIIPSGSLKLDQCTKIHDIPLFIDSHLEIVKAQNGKGTYYPYYQRLIQLKEIIKRNSVD